VSFLVIRLELVLPKSVTFAYQPAGNLASVSPPGRPPHGFAHTEVDLPREYDPPDVGAGPWATTLTWNLDRQLTRVTRPDWPI
jgi:hypothetical protein